MKKEKKTKALSACVQSVMQIGAGLNMSSRFCWFPMYLGCFQSPEPGRCYMQLGMLQTETPRPQSSESSGFLQNRPRNPHKEQCSSLGTADFCTQTRRVEVPIPEGARGHLLWTPQHQVKGYQAPQCLGSAQALLSLTNDPTPAALYSVPQFPH